MHDVEIVTIKEPISTNVINNFSINNMPFIQQRENNNYILDSLACCLLYFCCICVCPFNLVCGVYSYILASNDTSNNNFIRFCIKAFIILSIVLVIIAVIILIFLGPISVIN